MEGFAAVEFGGAEAGHAAEGELGGGWVMLVLDLVIVGRC